MTTINTTSKKLTKAQMFAQLKANYNLTADEVAFIDHELELLAKKNASGERKPSKLQEANTEIGKAILAGLERGKGYTVTEIAKTCNLRDAEGNLLATQKLSPICNKLVEAGSLIKTIEKRRSIFSLA